MPLIGLKCPPDSPTAGNCNDFEFCIASCPHQCQPTGVLNAIARDHQTNVHKGDMVSATSLKGCQRSLVLERTTDFYEEPHKLYYATRGGLYHGCLENDRTDMTTEVRLYKTVTTGPQAPWVISGQIDFYDIKRKSLEDYKTMADKGLYLIFNKGAKVEHIQQVNVYRWLMWGGHIESPTGPQVFWPVDKMKIHYLLMNRAISTGQVHHEYQSDRKSPNYGKKYGLEIDHGHRTVDGKFRRLAIGLTTRGVPQWRLDIDVPAIPMWPSADVEAMIANEGPPRVLALRDPNVMPGGVMNDYEERWQCDWCPVKDKCDDIEAQLAMDRQ